MISRHSTSRGAGTGIRSVPTTSARTISSARSPATVMSLNGMPSNNGEGSPISTASLPRQLPPAEHRADLGAAVAAIPRPEARKSLLARVVAAARWLDDSWLGDLIAVTCIFVAGYLMFFAAGVLS